LRCSYGPSAVPSAWPSTGARWPVMSRAALRLHRSVCPRPCRLS